VFSVFTYLRHIGSVFKILDRRYTANFIGHDDQPSLPPRSQVLISYESAESNRIQAPAIE